MNKKIVAQNRTVLLGVDVHTASHVVSVKVAGQEMAGTCSMAPSRDAWRSFLRRFPGCELHVVYESGPHGYTLHDWLVELREEYEGGAIFVYIAPPAMVPRAPGRKRMKTDRRDSASLIQAFETKSFRPVVVPDRESREERELVRTREQMMGMRKQLKNQIHGMVKSHGVEYPRQGAKWFGKWIEQLAENVKAADTTGNLYYAFRVKLKMLKETSAAISRLDKRIARLYEKGRCGETARKLSGLTGIGRLSSVIIATEVADFAAFDNSDAFASYVGVVPGETSSGESTRRGHITRAGNRRLRWIFTECAWSWVRHDPEARKTFNRLRAGKHERSKIAIVAMARRLAVRAYHQVVNGPPADARAA